MGASVQQCWLFSVLGHWRWFLIYVVFPVWQAKIRYRKVVPRLRRKFTREKIRVLFVTGAPSKWKCQSLYDLMADDPRYEPIICQTICDIENTSLSHTERVAFLDRCKAFYAQRGMRYVEAYDRERPRWTDLNDFNPDIVFYNQSWDYDTTQLPHHVARMALTFQIPYFVANYGSVKIDVQTPFQRTLFRYCTLNRDWADLYRRNVSPLCFAGGFLPIGHTALDVFYLNRDVRHSGQYVIYAPHWSIDCPGNENDENYSTFLLTGERMLSFAQAHPEIKWVFKPHPTLRCVLEKTGVWPMEKIAAYYDSWGHVGMVCDTGGYERLFMESRTMITDCGSFLTEFACTGSPIIHLISPTAKIRPLKPSAELYATYYQVHDDGELSQALEAVVLKGCDPKREDRLAKVREAGLLGNHAARNMLEYLDGLMTGGV